MKKISIEQFCGEYLNAWIEAMNDEDKVLLNSWHGLHSWTDAHMANVLYPLAKKLGYANKYGTGFQKEYYRVDFTLYDYFEQSVWTLDFAIEHENAEFELESDNSIKYKGWYDEFAKLLPLKCANSRVIIGYDCFTDNFEKKIKKCRDLLINPNIQASLSDGSILLIIFPRTNYIRKCKYENGLIHIVHFYKNGNNWDIEKNFENKVCDDGMLIKLQEVYKKIAEKY